MFCQNCGNQLSDDANVCSNCGKPIDTVKKSVKTNVSKKTLTIIIAGVIAVVCFFLFGGGPNSSPEKVAVATVKSEYEADADLMVKCFADFRIVELAEEYNLPLSSSRSEVARKIKEDYRYVTPEKVTNAKAEVVNMYDANDYVIWREYYDYMTDNDYNAIKRVAEVDVSFEHDGELDYASVICIEMGNKWYFLKVN